MSTTESVKASREQTRTHRQSSLIQGNIIAFVFRSLDLNLFSSSVPSTILQYSSEPLAKDEHQCNHEEAKCNPYQLLQYFFEANKNSFNKRLVESFGELKLAGWLAPCTLLLAGPNEEIEIFRTAWGQRILRNPKGFMLKDVGILKNFVFEWIPHSQFISLTTALHDTVTELDRNDRCASRDAIVKYLKNVYHNVRIPSEDIIHKCLGKLIEQRKIYHDGVGYRALIDDSPIRKPKVSETLHNEIGKIPVNNSTKSSVADSEKFSTKSSLKTASNGGSVFQSSAGRKDVKNRSARKVNGSDGSSKDDATSRTQSDEDKLRLSLLDNLVNATTPRMKSPKESKKTSPLSTKAMKSSMYQEIDEEIKIIDISESNSILRQGGSPGTNVSKEITTKSSVMGNEAALRHSGQPYDNHSRDGKPAKRAKPHRSRSFTEPSKQRGSNSKGNERDFPLRRVMGTDELRNLKKTSEKKGIHDAKSNKYRSDKDDKARKDKKDRCSQDKKRPDKTAKSILNEIKMSDNLENCIDAKDEKFSVPKWGLNHKKAVTDSDTPSGTCTSDTSSPFQSKKRKDGFEECSNNNEKDAMSCLCLTGKIVDGCLDEGKGDEITEIVGKEEKKIDESIEDASIFDYIDSKNDCFDYDCEGNVDLRKDNIDSIDFGYSV